MHVRFTIQHYLTILEVENIVWAIGNPKLTFHDYYFWGEVDSKYIPQLYDLKEKGMIQNLGFMVVSDEPRLTISNQDG